METVDDTDMPVEAPEIATAQLPEKACPSGMSGCASVRSGLDARCHVNMTSKPDMPGGSVEFSTSLSSSPIPSGVEGVLLTGNGLMMQCDAVDAEAYNHLFRTILTLHKSCCWLLGDVLLLGERQWGNQYTESKYEEAMQATGLTAVTLRLIVLTCRRFPVELRRADLSFTHHQEIARTAADPDQREDFLRQAAEQQLSCAALRQLLRQARFARAQETVEEVDRVTSWEAQRVHHKTEFMGYLACIDTYIESACKYTTRADREEQAHRLEQAAHRLRAARTQP